MRNKKKKSEKGRVLIFTGDGKGKTTAALGTALRAAGHGLHVLVIQFVKARPCGEHAAAQKLASHLDIRLMGTGFLREDDRDAMERARLKAREALLLAEQELKAGGHALVILDEVLFAVSKGLLSSEQLKQAVLARRPGVHVILTGRGLPPELAELADTVTEMKCVSHAYDSGTEATPGIEF